MSILTPENTGLLAEEIKGALPSIDAHARLWPADAYSDYLTRRDEALEQYDQGNADCLVTFAFAAVTTERLYRTPGYAEALAASDAPDEGTPGSIAELLNRIRDERRVG
jgi:hypothetical protein